MVESTDSGMLIVPRFNVVLNEVDCRVAVLGLVQSMGYSSPTENQKSALF